MKVDADPQMDPSCIGVSFLTSADDQTKSVFVLDCRQFFARIIRRLSLGVPRADEFEFDHFRPGTAHNRIGLEK